MSVMSLDDRIKLILGEQIMQIVSLTVQLETQKEAHEKTVAEIVSRQKTKTKDATK